jgi:hypothetical protein
VGSASTVIFTATAIDNTGATTASAPLTITVGGSSSSGGGGSNGGSSGTTFTLTVQGGTGSGTWPLYAWVNATASPPPPGQVFAGWTVMCTPCPALQLNDKANPALQIYARSGGSVTISATYEVSQWEGRAGAFSRVCCWI